MTKQMFDQFPEEMWVAAVQVATVWTEPASAREIDRSGTANPTNIEAWIDGLSYEMNLALCTENRVQSQLLFGEPVIVTETKGDWAHVVIPSQPSKKDERGYPGWVPLNQLSQVKKSDWQKDQTAAVNTDKAWLENENKEKVMKLSYMTILPAASTDDNRIEVVTPLGNHYISRDNAELFRTEDGLRKGNGLDIVKAGEPFLSLDYFWGGMSSFGYDCSGLSYAVHKANGYNIARDAGDQAAAGKEVAFDALETGDLLFFAYEEGKGALHHVGIYYGDGKMLHSPQTGKGIEITELKGTKYEKELCAARRYWQK
ncbi:C40 family peptidase [Virgibacillus sp. YIM 98842]|jgi:cell wall-associated NlpC family hydrolase|uniref:C40 family peptidase n=1 Tax=Virgibacillus sp. YIM 98842 TaxID=2663533 RepID=UPI0013DAF4C4|nr:C40 family peptidase [Virgibacillus sp. YIM 98842]